MGFKHPYVGIFVLAVLSYGYWYLWRYKRVFYPASFLVKRQIRSIRFSWIIGYLPFFIELLILLSLLLGSSGVYIQKRDEQLISQSVRTVWILLDVSESMNTPYASKTRLQYAKQMIDSLLDHTPEGIQYGMMIFAEGAYILSPPTQDRLFLKSVLKAIKPHYIQDKGTDMAKALTILFAANRESEIFQQGYGVLLFSDGGENRNAISYANIVQYAQSHGISISGFCIGDSLVYDPEKKRIVRTDYNPDAMAYLAFRTGGFLQSSSQWNFSLIEKWLSQIPVIVQQRIIWQEPEDLSFPFYLLALILLSCWVLGKLLGIFNPLED